MNFICSVGWIISMPNHGCIKHVKLTMNIDMYIDNNGDMYKPSSILVLGIFWQTSIFYRWWCYFNFILLNKNLYNPVYLMYQTHVCSYNINSRQVVVYNLQKKKKLN